MNTRGLLDQLLKSGQDLLQQKGTPSAGGLGGLLGGAAGKSGGDLATLLKGAGGGALAAGALGLLLGSKSARKVGSQVITYGGLAALGVMAYKAYGNWQTTQADGAAPALPPQTVDRLPAPQVELHSQAILKALVAAAKADGHVDERERQLLEEQLGTLAGDAQLSQWLQAELNKPLDPAEVARAASTPEMAAEMYLASVLMVDEEHFMECAYLEELARQLKLEPALKAELEAQVQQALAKA
ncbi:MAG TPA: tellurite resistance TerB family protein [Pseudomonas sp.]|nr:tellurite resistance TerB family protein [Pseudomonas sp.]